MEEEAQLDGGSEDGSAGMDVGWTEIGPDFYEQSPPQLQSL